MAITLPRAIPLGGGVTEYSGTFSHTLGAAEETFKLGSARVLSVYVSNQDAGANSEDMGSVMFTESVSGSTNTVTVHFLGGVTSGRIVVKAFAGN